MYSILYIISFIWHTHICNGINYEYYVSIKNGNDKTGNGSKFNPYATINKAQLSIQQFITTLPNNYNGNITVNIESGKYAEKLNFTAKDSLSQINDGNNYIIYQGMSPNQSYTNNTSSIIGGDIIQTQWTKTNSPNNPNVNTIIWQARLKNVSTDNDNNLYQLYANSLRINMSHTTILQYEYLDINTSTIQTNKTVIPNIENILATNYSMNMIAVVYEAFEDSHHQVKYIQYNPINNKINITLNIGPHKSGTSGASGNRFYLMNNYQLFSNQNQFYYNKTTHTLYIMLSNAYNPNEMEIIYAKQMEILSMNSNAKRLIFRNLNIEYSDVDFIDCFASNCQTQSATFLATATVHITYSQYIIFQNVYIQHTGGYSIWFDKGSKNCYFDHNMVYDSGCGGVRIGNNQSRIIPSNELVTNITVSNNYIIYGGKVFQMGSGLMSQSAANITISNNEIAYFFYTGISSGYTWSFAETSVSNINIFNNYIHDIGQWVLSDLGCIYTLGAHKNSFITNNICHDIWCFDYGCCGTYTDQGSRYITFENNIVYNTKMEGHCNDIALDIVILNSIYAFTGLVNCEGQGIISNQRNGDCNLTESLYNTACSSLTFITNIVYVNSTFNKDIFGDPYKTKYKNFTFDGNTYWSITQQKNITFPDGASIEQWQSNGKDVQVAMADPMFVDAMTYNFNLKTESPALALGFTPIDTSVVGPDWIFVETRGND
eukprot:491030_1